MIRRALVSVSDKRGLESLGRALAEAGVEILSTGGSARALAAAGVPVVEVSEHTGFPEIMDGRVKTLHPTIHGGILARTGTDDAVAAEHGISPIDLVVVNLYPFAETVARPGCSLPEAIENIDIGGPALLRAAAKNHERVTVLCRPEDYEAFAASLPAGPDAETRRRLAREAFAHTAAYDGQISQWLAEREAPGELPAVFNLNLDRVRRLRYGENPHQVAAVYREHGREGAGLAACEPVQGKPLSYNNLLDADAAWAAVGALSESPACVIVKHNNPCGAAVADSVEEAWFRALACDPVSAFGGIVAVNRPLDGPCARAVTRRFLEVVVAPGLDAAAREVLAEKPDLRVLVPGVRPPPGVRLSAIDGGWLVQTADDPAEEAPEAPRVVTRRAPEEDEWRDLRLAWQLVRVVRSNAIVLVRDGATVGIGAGQMSRVDSVRIAISKAADAGLELAGAAMASDAFFPFADGIEAAVSAGVRAIVQPGGSKRDAEVIAAADSQAVAMVFTGRRHFRH